MNDDKKAKIEKEKQQINCSRGIDILILCGYDCRHNSAYNNDLVNAHFQLTGNYLAPLKSSEEKRVFFLDFFLTRQLRICFSFLVFLFFIRNWAHPLLSLLMVDIC